LPLSLIPLVGALAFTIFHTIAGQQTPPLSCDLMTPVERRSLVVVMPTSGELNVSAWFLFVRGPAPQGQPPRRCDPRNSDCLAHSPIAADSAPFELLMQEDGWSCVERNGPGTMWVRSENIKPVVPDSQPSVADWIGHWVQGDGYIDISSSDRTHVRIEGENDWRGIGDVVHTGQIFFEVAPITNPLALANRGCEVTMTLVGDYLLLHDNMGCGGMNVRFQGAWKRSTNPK
jgi:hypothetical protein